LAIFPTGREDFKDNKLCGKCKEFYSEWGGTCIYCGDVRRDDLLGGLFVVRTECISNASVLSYVSASWLVLTTSIHSQVNFILVIIVYYTSQSQYGDMKILMFFIQCAIMFAGIGFRWAHWSQVRLASFGPHRVCVSGRAVCAASNRLLDSDVCNRVIPQTH